MNDDDHLEIWIKISQQIGGLCSDIKSVLAKLTDHETRIGNLERGKTGIKDNILKWLVIGLIASIGIIATLTGSTAIITQMISL